MKKGDWQCLFKPGVVVCAHNINTQETEAARLLKVPGQSKIYLKNPENEMKKKEEKEEKRNKERKIRNISVY